MFANVIQRCGTMEGLNNHHVFFEKKDFRRRNGAARKLMHLSTVLVPVHEVHRVIHEELKPMPVPSHDLANYMLQAARSVHERGIERMQAIIDSLTGLNPDSVLSEEAQFYLEHLSAQRTIMEVHYGICTPRTSGADSLREVAPVDIR